MDKVERSFAAATAAGFVVLVIGIVLLAAPAIRAFSLRLTREEGSA